MLNDCPEEITERVEQHRRWLSLASPIGRARQQGVVARAGGPPWEIPANPRAGQIGRAQPSDPPAAATVGADVHAPDRGARPPRAAGEDLGFVGEGGTEAKLEGALDFLASQRRGAAMAVHAAAPLNRWSMWLGGSTLRVAIRQRGDQRIDVPAGVVERQRDANGALVPEPPHDRLRAVVAGPHGDPLAVERLADLLWGEPVEQERQYGGLLGGGADQLQAGYARQRSCRVGE